MKHITFEYISPDKIQLGDTVACYAHDDQWERTNTRVVDIWRQEISGSLLVGGDIFRYSYCIHLICRHISLKNLEACGGPYYPWLLYPWNGVTRYSIDNHPESIIGKPL